jgi:hypothetical protein
MNQALFTIKKRLEICVSTVFVPKHLRRSTATLGIYFEPVA